MPSAARPPQVDSLQIDSLQVDPLVALADRCVQCGLCLPACPTYGRDRLEAESPRGRIALMRGWALEAIEATPTGDAHLDHCLACRNCEAVCPAGVKYGQLLIGARGRQRDRRGARWGQRAIEWLSARPALLARALGAYRVMYGWLPMRMRGLPRPPTRMPSARRGAAGNMREPLPDATRVGLFVGCVAATYEQPLRAAVVRLCAALGVQVVDVPGLTCCGTLPAHAGNTRLAQQLAARNRQTFSQSAADRISTLLTLASGCHGAVADALDGITQTADAIAFIDTHGAQLQWRQCRQRVALHLPCTQRNVSRSVAALRRLLARVPGLEVVELDAGFGCCGAAGTQMLTDPARADDYRRPLLAQFHASGATALLSANIGCRLHFANATDAAVQHPLEFLAGLLDDGASPVPACNPAAAVDCAA